MADNVLSVMLSLHAVLAHTRHSAEIYPVSALVLHCSVSISGPHVIVNSLAVWMFL